MLMLQVQARKEDRKPCVWLWVSLCLLLMLGNNIAVGDETRGLSIFTSGNTQSNAARSFVVVPRNMEIPQGITRASVKGVLRKQLPFKIEILDSIEAEQQIQWQVTIPSNDFGRIRVRSDYSGRKKVTEVDTVWTSFLLDRQIPERHILLFEPREQKHRSPVYTKGKPTVAGGKSWGGGTEDIDVSFRNPRLKYLVEARIIDTDGNLVARYNTEVEMDDKDMIRQEYINHYQIGRSTAGAAGNLPIPTREEIQIIPQRPNGYEGNGLTESKYELIIEDGASDLASLLLDAFEGMKSYYRQPGNEFKDLNGKQLSIPDSRLWLSSGWRNPERNEWFSDALNGAHQLGIALDIMPNEIPRNREAAIVYWVLWEAVSSLPDQHKIFAQLEALTVPLRPSAYKVDVEPRNGIPDAFDKADHLHINLVYD